MDMTAQEIAEKIMNTKSIEDLDLESTVIKNDIWAEWLWPVMAWSIYTFNAVIGLHFLVNSLYLKPEEYEWARHIVTIVTMCGSYMFLLYTHKNYLRGRYGRSD